MKRDAFSGFHPAVNFLYFTLVLVFSMLFMQPACLLISLFSAAGYAVYLSGGKAARRTLFYILPLILITAVLNPLFNHEGATVLAYFPGGNPLTLESVVYGLAAGAMLAAVICWFSCCQAVMTSDKLIYLFGKAVPSLSLVLSMTLRFVPKFKEQFAVVAGAQKCAGRGIDAAGGRLFRRFKNGARILSIMVTWMLESALETADAMKSRGYGLPGRTAFSIFRFDKRDRKAFCVLVFAGLYVAAGAFNGATYFSYFPTMRGASPDLYTVSVLSTYLALCLMPVIINLSEDKKWKSLQSAV